MANLNILKDRGEGTLPILLLQVTFNSGTINRYATHAVSFGGNSYAARVLEISTFQMQTKSEIGLDTIARMQFRFSNTTQFFSGLDISEGFKGARLKVLLVIFEVDTVLGTLTASSDSRTVFSGYFDAPSIDSDTEFEIEAINFFNMERVILPPVRLQRHDPYLFPITSTDRTAGLTDQNSRFWNFPYSADILSRSENGTIPSSSTTLTLDTGSWTDDDTSRTVDITGANFGSGVTTAQIIERISSTVVELDKTNTAAVTNQNVDINGFGKLDTGEVAFASYDGTKRQAVLRGMYGKNITPTLNRGHIGFYGGSRFVPPTMHVRTFGGDEFFETPVTENKARYGRRIPLVYGTNVIEPIVAFQRGEANETKMIAILSWGEIDRIGWVRVDDVNIPKLVSSTDPNNSLRGFWFLHSGKRGQVQAANFPAGDPMGGDSLPVHPNSTCPK